MRDNNGIIVGGNMTNSSASVSNPGRSAGPRPKRAGVDALIIAALKDEYDAAKKVAGVSRWQEHGVRGSEPYSTATFRTRSGETISVALARPTRMGGRSIGAITTTLTNELRPACLAMCGVCAGNPGDTAPGDVIVAAPAYEWDEGKHTGDVFRADHQQFPQDNRWVRAVQDFDPSGLPSHGVATDEEAAVWYLERLYKGQDPRTHPARKRYFPRSTWETRLERLRSDGLIAWRDDRWALTGEGLAHIQQITYNNVDGPERLPFEVAAGPMASGSAVMSDPDIWDRLEVTQRKILALEMEAATIATVAHERQVPHWLVAKGVMDHANFDKDDRFKAFAAKASAEVLFALLGRLLSPAAASPRPVKPAGEIPGYVKLEILRRLTYDWQDLADAVGVPSYEMRRFRAGDEPRELWTWLEARARLSDLSDALHEIGRTDLAGLLRPYV
jgi:nucleoside phosphorylase